MKNQENTQRDSYGKVNFVNVPHMNTGSVADIQCGKEEDEELDKALQELSDSLDESYQKSNMDEYFARQLS
ncbi:CJH_07325 family protein [Helicobacter rodentium]|uniref:CJH_07325 family protein n=1 Tax=Helicobacter rodentium TaxID=59617 RepID=UPI0023533E2F|nr:CJH_07325 family protein [Helicobacter rodentium]